LVGLLKRSAGRLELLERNIALAQTRFRITSAQSGRDGAGRSGQLGADFVAKVGCFRSAVGHFVENGRH
jgi:hypothetical protein